MDKPELKPRLISACTAISGIAAVLVTVGFGFILLIITVRKIIVVPNDYDECTQRKETARIRMKYYTPQDCMFVVSPFIHKIITAIGFEPYDRIQKGSGGLEGLSGHRLFYFNYGFEIPYTYEQCINLTGLEAGNICFFDVIGEIVLASPQKYPSDFYSQIKTATTTSYLLVSDTFFQDSPISPFPSWRSDFSNRRVMFLSSECYISDENRLCGDERFVTCPNCMQVPSYGPVSERAFCYRKCTVDADCPKGRKCAGWVNDPPVCLLDD